MVRRARILAGALQVAKEPKRLDFDRPGTSIFDSFVNTGGRLLGHFFCSFCWFFPERLLGDSGSQKVSKRVAFGHPLGDIFLKHKNLIF